jgi:hypothetical protein
MSLKISTSILAASFAIAAFVGSVGTSAAAAGDKQQFRLAYKSPLARNGIDTAPGLYNYAGHQTFAPAHYQSPLARNGIDTAHRLQTYTRPELFSPVRYPWAGYTDNHDAWMDW